MFVLPLKLSETNSIIVYSIEFLTSLRFFISVI